MMLHKSRFMCSRVECDQLTTTTTKNVSKQRQRSCLQLTSECLASQNMHAGTLSFSARTRKFVHDSNHFFFLLFARHNKNETSEFLLVWILIAEAHIVEHNVCVCVFVTPFQPRINCKKTLSYSVIIIYLKKRTTWNDIYAQSCTCVCTHAQKRVYISFPTCHKHNCQTKCTRDIEFNEMHVRSQKNWPGKFYVFPKLSARAPARDERRRLVILLRMFTKSTY